MASLVDPPLWAVAAALGGVLWAIKSLSILIAGVQPEYIFELATLFFAIAVLGLVRLLNAAGRTGAILILGAWAGVAAGSLATVAYILNGEDDSIFGPALLVTMLTVLALLLYVGRAIARQRLLGTWSIAPFALPWLMIAALPIGGALEGLNERLLEVPLLVVGLGWLALAAAGISHALARPSISPTS